MKMLFRHEAVGSAVALALAVCLCGCIFEYPDCPPDEETDGRVKVEFDWAHAPQAAPDGMGILLYPSSGHSFWRYDLRPAGGFINPPDGHYHILTFNNDTERVLFEDSGDFNTICLTTRTAQLTDGLTATYLGAQPPRGREEAAQPVMAQPDMMWSAASPAATLSEGDTIRLAPRQIIARYTVEVDSLVNGASAVQMCMAVSGLSIARVLADSANVDYAVTVPGSIYRHASPALRGELLTFGDCASAPRNTLYIYFWLRDGQKQLHQFDVSGQVDGADDPLNVVIRIHRIELPVTQGPSQGEGTGMDVGVDNWETVDIELSN